MSKVIRLIDQPLIDNINDQLFFRGKKFFELLHREDVVYKKGDYCIIESGDEYRYYKCGDNNIAGAFDPNKWTEVTFEQMFSQPQNSSFSKREIIINKGHETEANPYSPIYIQVPDGGLITTVEGYDTDDRKIFNTHIIVTGDHIRFNKFLQSTQVIKSVDLRTFNGVKTLIIYVKNGRYVIYAPQDAKSYTIKQSYSVDDGSRKYLRCIKNKPVNLIDAATKADIDKTWNFYLSSDLTCDPLNQHGTCFYTENDRLIIGSDYEQGYGTDQWFITPDYIKPNTNYVFRIIVDEYNSDFITIGYSKINGVPYNDITSKMNLKHRDGSDIFVNYTGTDNSNIENKAIKIHGKGIFNFVVKTPKNIDYNMPLFSFFSGTPEGKISIVDFQLYEDIYPERSEAGDFSWIDEEQIIAEDYIQDGKFHKNVGYFKYDETKLDEGLEVWAGDKNTHDKVGFSLQSCYSGVICPTEIEKLGFVTDTGLDYSMCNHEFTCNTDTKYYNEYIAIDDNYIVTVLNTNKVISESVEGFRDYLKTNPITILYALPDSQKEVWDADTEETIFGYSKKIGNRIYSLDYDAIKDTRGTSEFNSVHTLDEFNIIGEEISITLPINNSHIIIPAENSKTVTDYNFICTYDAYEGITKDSTNSPITTDTGNVSTIGMNKEKNIMIIADLIKSGSHYIPIIRVLKRDNGIWKIQSIKEANGNSYLELTNLQDEFFINNIIHLHDDVYMFTIGRINQNSDKKVGVIAKSVSITDITTTENETSNISITIQDFVQYNELNIEHTLINSSFNKKDGVLYSMYQNDAMGILITPRRVISDTNLGMDDNISSQKYTDFTINQYGDILFNEIYNMYIVLINNTLYMIKREVDIEDSTNTEDLVANLRVDYAGSLFFNENRDILYVVCKDSNKILSFSVDYENYTFTKLHELSVIIPEGYKYINYGQKDASISLKYNLLLVTYRSSLSPNSQKDIVRLISFDKYGILHQCDYEENTLTEYIEKFNTNDYIINNCSFVGDEIVASYVDLNNTNFIETTSYVENNCIRYNADISKVLPSAGKKIVHKDSFAFSMEVNPESIMVHENDVSGSVHVYAASADGQYILCKKVITNGVINEEIVFPIADFTYGEGFVKAKRFQKIDNNYVLFVAESTHGDFLGVVTYGDTDNFIGIKTFENLGLFMCIKNVQILKVSDSYYQIWFTDGATRKDIYVCKCINGQLSVTFGQIKYNIDCITPYPNNNYILKSSQKEGEYVSFITSENLINLILNEDDEIKCINLEEDIKVEKICDNVVDTTVSDSKGWLPYQINSNSFPLIKTKLSDGLIGRFYTINQLNAANRLSVSLIDKTNGSESFPIHYLFDEGDEKELLKGIELYDRYVAVIYRGKDYRSVTSTESIPQFRLINISVESGREHTSVNDYVKYFPALYGYVVGSKFVNDTLYVLNQPINGKCRLTVNRFTAHDGTDLQTSFYSLDTSASNENIYGDVFVDNNKLYVLLDKLYRYNFDGTKYILDKTFDNISADGGTILKLNGFIIVIPRKNNYVYKINPKNDVTEDYEYADKDSEFRYAGFSDCTVSLSNDIVLFRACNMEDDMFVPDSLKNKSSFIVSLFVNNKNELVVDKNFCRKLPVYFPNPTYVFESFYYNYDDVNHMMRYHCYDYINDHKAISYFNITHKKSYPALPEELKTGLITEIQENKAAFMVQRDAIFNGDLEEVQIRNRECGDFPATQNFYYSPNKEFMIRLFAYGDINRSNGIYVYKRDSNGIYQLFSTYYEYDLYMTKYFSYPIDIVFLNEKNFRVIMGKIDFNDNLHNGTPHLYTYVEFRILTSGMTRTGYKNVYESGTYFKSLSSVTPYTDNYEGSKIHTYVNLVDNPNTYVYKCINGETTTSITSDESKNFTVDKNPPTVRILTTEHMMIVAAGNLKVYTKGDINAWTQEFEMDSYHDALLCKSNDDRFIFAISRDEKTYEAVVHVFSNDIYSIREIYTYRIPICGYSHPVDIGNVSVTTHPTENMIIVTLYNHFINETSLETLRAGLSSKSILLGYNESGEVTMLNDDVVKLLNFDYDYTSYLVRGMRFMDSGSIGYNIILYNDNENKEKEVIGIKLLSIGDYSISKPINHEAYFVGHQPYITRFSKNGQWMAVMYDGVSGIILYKYDTVAKRYYKYSYFTFNKNNCTKTYDILVLDNGMTLALMYIGKSGKCAVIAYKTDNTILKTINLPLVNPNFEYKPYFTASDDLSFIDICVGKARYCYSMDKSTGAVTIIKENLEYGCELINGNIELVEYDGIVYSCIYGIDYTNKQFVMSLSDPKTHAVFKSCSIKLSNFASYDYTNIEFLSTRNIQFDKYIIINLGYRFTQHGMFRVNSYIFDINKPQETPSLVSVVGDRAGYGYFVDKDTKTIFNIYTNVDGTLSLAGFQVIGGKDRRTLQINLPITSSLGGIDYDQNTGCLAIPAELTDDNTSPVYIIKLRKLIRQNNEFIPFETNSTLGQNLEFVGFDNKSKLLIYKDLINNTFNLYKYVNGSLKLIKYISYNNQKPLYYGYDINGNMWFKFRGEPTTTIGGMVYISLDKLEITNVTSNASGFDYKSKVHYDTLKSFEAHIKNNPETNASVGLIIWHMDLSKDPINKPKWYNKELIGSNGHTILFPTEVTGMSHDKVFCSDDLKYVWLVQYATSSENAGNVYLLKISDDGTSMSYLGSNRASSKAPIKYADYSRKYNSLIVSCDTHTQISYFTIDNDNIVIKEYRACLPEHNCSNEYYEKIYSGTQLPFVRFNNLGDMVVIPNINTAWNGNSNVIVSRVNENGLMDFPFGRHEITSKSGIQINHENKGLVLKDANFSLDDAKLFISLGLEDDGSNNFLRSLPDGTKDTIENGIITRRVGVKKITDVSDWATTTPDKWYYPDNHINITEDKCAEIFITDLQMSNVYVYNSDNNQRCLCNYAQGMGFADYMTMFNTYPLYKTFSTVHNYRDLAINIGKGLLNNDISLNGVNNWLKEHPILFLYKLEESEYTTEYTNLTGSHEGYSAEKDGYIESKYIELNQRVDDGSSRFLRSLPNGISDTMENGVITRRVGVVKIDDISDWKTTNDPLAYADYNHIVNYLGGKGDDLKHYISFCELRYSLSRTKSTEWKNILAELKNNPHSCIHMSNMETDVGYYNPNEATIRKYYTAGGTSDMRHLRISIPKSLIKNGFDVGKVNAWIKSNPIIILYPLTSDEYYTETTNNKNKESGYSEKYDKYIKSKYIGELRDDQYEDHGTANFLRSLPSGVKDTIENGVITRRVGVVRIDDISDWTFVTNQIINTENSIVSFEDYKEYGSLVGLRYVEKNRSTYISSTDTMIRTLTDKFNSSNRADCISLTHTHDTPYVGVGMNRSLYALIPTTYFPDGVTKEKVVEWFDTIKPLTILYELQPDEYYTEYAPFNATETSGFSYRNEKENVLVSNYIGLGDINNMLVYDLPYKHENEITCANIDKDNDLIVTYKKERFEDYLDFEKEVVTKKFKYPFDELDMLHTGLTNEDSSYCKHTNFVNDSFVSVQEEDNGTVICARDPHNNYNSINRVYIDEFISHFHHVVYSKHNVVIVNNNMGVEVFGLEDDYSCTNLNSRTLKLIRDVNAEKLVANCHTHGCYTPIDNKPFKGMVIDPYFNKALYRESEIIQTSLMSPDRVFGIENSIFDYHPLTDTLNVYYRPVLYKSCIEDFTLLSTPTLYNALANVTIDDHKISNNVRFFIDTKTKKVYIKYVYGVEKQANITLGGISASSINDILFTFNYDLKYLYIININRNKNTFDMYIYNYNEIEYETEMTLEPYVVDKNRPCNPDHIFISNTAEEQYVVTDKIIIDVTFTHYTSVTPLYNNASIFHDISSIFKDVCSVNSNYVVAKYNESSYNSALYYLTEDDFGTLSSGSQFISNLVIENSEILNLDNYENRIYVLIERYGYKFIRSYDIENDKFVFVSELNVPYDMETIKYVNGYIFVTGRESMQVYEDENFGNTALLLDNITKYKFDIPTPNDIQIEDNVVSRDGKYLITRGISTDSSSSQFFHVFKLNENNRYEICDQATFDKLVFRRVCFTHDDTYRFIAGGQENGIALYKIENDKVIQLSKTDIYSNYHISEVSPDNKYVVSIDSLGDTDPYIMNVNIFKLENDNLIYLNTIEFPNTADNKRKGLLIDIKFIDNETFVMGTWCSQTLYMCQIKNNEGKLIDSKTNTFIDTFSTHRINFFNEKMFFFEGNQMKYTTIDLENYTFNNNNIDTGITIDGVIIDTFVIYKTFILISARKSSAWKSENDVSTVYVIEALDNFTNFKIRYNFELNGAISYLNIINGKIYGTFYRSPQVWEADLQQLITATEFTNINTLTKYIADSDLNPDSLKEPEYDYSDLLNNVKDYTEKLSTAINSFNMNNAIIDQILTSTREISNESSLSYSQLVYLNVLLSNFKSLIESEDIQPKEIGIMSQIASLKSNYSTDKTIDNLLLYEKSNNLYAQNIKRVLNLDTPTEFTCMDYFNDSYGRVIPYVNTKLDDLSSYIYILNIDPFNSTMISIPWNITETENRISKSKVLYKNNFIYLIYHRLNSNNEIEVVVRKGQLVNNTINEICDAKVFKVMDYDASIDSSLLETYINTFVFNYVEYIVITNVYDNTINSFIKIDDNKHDNTEIKAELLNIDKDLVAQRINPKNEKINALFEYYNNLDIPSILVCYGNSIYSIPFEPSKDVVPMGKIVKLFEFDKLHDVKITRNGMIIVLIEEYDKLAIKVFDKELVCILSNYSLDIDKVRDKKELFITSKGLCVVEYTTLGIDYKKYCFKSDLESYLYRTDLVSNAFETANIENIIVSYSGSLSYIVSTSENTKRIHVLA